MIPFRRKAAEHTSEAPLLVAVSLVVVGVAIVAVVVNNFSIPGLSRPGPALKINTFQKDLN